MRISKKFILSLLCFLLVLVILSSIIMYPVYHYELRSYRDGNLRESLAGEIDYLFLGASHGVTAYCPSIVDAELGNSSYNLSCQMMDWDSRIYMLEKELARNPVKHVVIEVAHNALYRDEKTEYAEGTTFTVMRMDSLGEALRFMLEYVSINDWLNIYSRLLTAGLAQWLDLLHGDMSKQLRYENRGFYPMESNAITLDDAPDVSIHTNYLPENVERLEQLIQMCKDFQIKCSIVVVPVSDAYLYNSSGCDDFYEYMENFSQEHGCEFLDFNLLRNRYSILSDSYSFYDSVHMSEAGAKAFSKTYADVIKSLDNGDSIDTLFYSSYQEMLADSPYMK